MHFSATALLLLATKAIHASPVIATTRDTSVPESIANATAMGVDVYAPIPSDATLVEAGHYTAEPGTKAWAWIRAQIDLDQLDAPSSTTAGVEKRQWANIGIGMFAQDWCTGQAAWFDDVQYNVHHISNTNMYSVGISYRGLRDNEHLDFSRLSGGDWCGTYVYSAGYMTPVGCFNSQAITCFRLWT